MSNEQLISYNNSSELKQEICHEVREHVKNDRLIQGEGWNEENQQGCFVGCLTHCYDHQKASIKLGIPVWMLRLADKIHEGLPLEKTGEFFIGFFDALQKGMTKQHTDRILHQFLYYTLTNIIPQQYQTKKEIAKIIDMFENALDGGTKITIQAWRASSAAIASAYAAYASAAAADAASYASAAAADAAAADAAADAAASAADAASAAASASAASAASVVVASAYAAAASAADASAAANYTAVRHLSYEKMANALIQIIKKVEVKKVMISYQHRKLTNNSSVRYH